VVTPTFAVAQFVYPNLPFAAKDFTPVALFITTPLLLVVNPSLGFKTVGDYIKFAKANPGRITFASSGAGSTPHLGFELLMEQAGINLLHIPYKGGGEAVASVLSGTTDSYFSVPIESGLHRARASSLLWQAPPEAHAVVSTCRPSPRADRRLSRCSITRRCRARGHAARILNKLAEHRQAMQSPEVRDKFCRTATLRWARYRPVISTKEYKTWPGGSESRHQAGVGAMTAICMREVDHPSAWTPASLGNKDGLGRVVGGGLVAIKTLVERTRHKRPQEVTPTSTILWNRLLDRVRDDHERHSS
jgi:hypothetical protein